MDLRSETRARIAEAARKLGYRRNELAATIRTGSTQTVAVIGPFAPVEQHVGSFNLVMSGILLEASHLNYGIKIYADNQLQAAFDEILGNQIKLVLSMSVDQQCRIETAALCRLHQLKLVYIYETAHAEFPSVTSAEYDAARDAVRYLAGFGHRRIALLCNPHSFNYARERHAGYLAGLAATGIETDPRLIYCCGKDLCAGKQAIDAMLKMSAASRPTAFFCVTDGLAMLVQRVALKNALRIPEDLSVIGYGNSDFGQFALSPLSSIAQPFGKIGETALRLLLGKECDATPSADGRYLLPTQLICRESVASPCQF